MDCGHGGFIELKTIFLMIYEKVFARLAGWNYGKNLIIAIYADQFFILFVYNSKKKKIEN